LTPAKFLCLVALLHFVGSEVTSPGVPFIF